MFVRYALAVALGCIITVWASGGTASYIADAIPYEECLSLERKLKVFSADPVGNLIVATAERGWVLVYDGNGQLQECVNVTGGTDITLTDVMALNKTAAIVAGHKGYAARLAFPDHKGKSRKFVVDVSRLETPETSTTKLFKLGSAGAAGIVGVGTFGTIWSWADVQSRALSVTIDVADYFEPHFFDVAPLPSGEMLVVGEQGTILLVDMVARREVKRHKITSGGTLFGVETADCGGVGYGIDGQVLLIKNGLSDVHAFDHSLGRISLYASTKRLDGQIVIGGERGGVILISNEQCAVTSCPSHQRGSITALATLADNNLMAFTSSGRYVLRFDSDAACPKWSRSLSN